MKLLDGLKVAIVATNGFERSELQDTRKALIAAGAQTFVISPEKGAIRDWTDDEWGPEVKVDVNLSDANPADYDALLLPGGAVNPDRLRLVPQAIAFIKTFVDAQKPIAAICHGPWTLINAQGVKGKTMTSWPTLKVDLINAGANWVDKEVVVDGKLVTSRAPADIPAFNKAMIEMFAKYK